MFLFSVCRGRIASLGDSVSVETVTVVLQQHKVSMANINNYFSFYLASFSWR